MKNFLYVVIALAVIAVAGYFIVKNTDTDPKTEKQTQDSGSNNTGSNKETKNVEGDILMEGAIATIYYGDGCPHCTVIEKWLIDNKYLPNNLPVKQADVDSWIKNAKVKFNLKEIWYNKTNSAELSANAATLGLEDSQVGVPFLYDSVNKKSYIGETEIKKFFQSK